MHLLQQLALVAATIHSLSTPVHSRALATTSISSKQYGCPTCPTITCPDSLLPPEKYQCEHPGTPAWDKRSSILERVPLPVAPPRIRPKPEPDVPVVRPGDTPSRPGDPQDVPTHIGADGAQELAVGASKPGDVGPKLIGDSKPIEKIREKSERVENAPWATESSIDVDNLKRKLKEDYNVKQVSTNEELDSWLDGDLKGSFDKLNIDMETVKYHNTEIRSKATDINGKNKPIAQAEYFPDSGIIIGESRFSANDLNPPEKKVRPSDLTFLQWLDSASDPKSLRAFIGRNVLSHSTLETMQTAQRNARIPLDQPAVFKRQKDPQDGPDGDRNTDSFFLMMGTDFISNQGFMLKDHWQTLGKKEISEIWCFPRTYGPNDKEGMKEITITLLFKDIE